MFAISIEFLYTMHSIDLSKLVCAYRPIEGELENSVDPDQKEASDYGLNFLHLILSIINDDINNTLDISKIVKERKKSPQTWMNVLACTNVYRVIYAQSRLNSENVT